MTHIIDDRQKHILKSCMRIDILKTAVGRAVFYSAIVCISMVLISYSSSSACNVCHSKDPKMVKMHAALGFKDCFNCHGPGKKTSSPEQPDQRNSDPLCAGCHKK
jgi:predicted CXXCH cytochrome family protein